MTTFDTHYKPTESVSGIYTKQTTWAATTVQVLWLLGKKERVSDKIQSPSTLQLPLQYSMSTVHDHTKHDTI